MSKNHTAKRSAVSGRYVTKAIGGSKAEKFSAVEGMVLTRKNAAHYRTFKSSGLKGDALRSAISGSFKASKRK